MTTTTLLALLLLPLLWLVALIDLATMTPERRIRFLRSTGLSQRAIADRLSISRYRVSKVLQAA